MLGAKRRTFGNIVGHAEDVADMGSFAAWVADQFDPTLSWDDVRWLRRRWPRKLILKGIMDVEDARLAAQTGADVLVVSNHGGQQLDGAPSTISTLAEIVEAVGYASKCISMAESAPAGCAEGARAGRAGRSTSVRSFLCGLGALGEGRGDPQPRDHSHGTGLDHGLLRADGRVPG